MIFAVLIGLRAVIFVTVEVVKRLDTGFKIVVRKYHRLGEEPACDSVCTNKSTLSPNGACRYRR